MTISSMTGFARIQGEGNGLTWIWEVKSVNGRNFDVRCRLPSGMDTLESELRKLLAKTVKRGHVNVSLQVSRRNHGTRMRVNQTALDQIMEIAKSLPKDSGIAPPTLDGLLRVNGVLELIEEPESPEQQTLREQAMLQSFEDAVMALNAMRQTEGARLKAAIDDQVSELARLSKAARGTSALDPEVIHDNLKTRLQELLANTAGMPEERLVQEAAILAAKADVREEVDRLDAHVAAARGMLEAGGAVGRRIDFLAQELNREANTLCSKASDVTLTRIGLDMKAVIDQLREQIQNIE
ncbi:MAG: YicC/YloC family endoribonuclease [Sphingomonadales bacterium]